jgi:hypothetical protein
MRAAAPPERGNRQQCAPAWSLPLFRRPGAARERVEIRIEFRHREGQGAGLHRGITQATNGDEAAFNKLEKAVIDVVFDQVKVVMPTWAKIVSTAGLKQFELYRVHDQKVPPPAALRVPADNVLDQIYRFRCIVDPQLPKDMAMIAKNIASAVAKGPHFQPTSP